MKPFVIFTLLLVMILTARASSVIPLATPDLVQASDAVFRGTVVGMSCFKGVDGLIYTRTSLRVDEPLKGKFPEVLLVVHRGGRVGNEDEFAGLSPRFVANAEYLLFVTRGADGILHCSQGHASAFPLRHISAQSQELIEQDQLLLDEVRQLTQNGENPGADVTDQVGSAGITPLATTGMLGGINVRFLQPDRGEPIPYLIDADSLPSGITLAVATNAVQQALNAWAAVTSLKFKLEGIGGFGQGADTVTTSDEKLRIQLHDNFNSITTPSVLGIGGRNGTTSPSPAGWDLGGNVAGNEFMKSTRGYVVLEATNSSLQNTSTLAAVLCHEIGHALNMAHSSEIPTNDLVLSNSIMYFQAHKDGRGATLGSYDPPVIQQAYPSNTPPYSFSRVIDATTDFPSQPNIAGINEVELRGYDLQNSSLTLVTNGTDGVGTGTFTRTGNVIKFTPNDFWGTSRVNPSSTSYYEIIYARFSDGTNGSPYVTVRVISHNPDSFPSPAGDGIPDNWMTTFWGSANPAAGPNRGAQQDFDNDGIKNIDEYRSGMIPTNSTSAQRITRFTGGSMDWQAKAYDLYEMEGTTNFTNWTRVGVPFMPTDAPLSVLTNQIQTNITVTVSNLPTDNPKMFFRILKVP